MLMRFTLINARRECLQRHKVHTVKIDTDISTSEAENVSGEEQEMRTDCPIDRGGSGSGDMTGLPYDDNIEPESQPGW